MAAHALLERRGWHLTAVLYLFRALKRTFHDHRQVWRLARCCQVLHADSGGDVATGGLRAAIPLLLACTCCHGLRGRRLCSAAVEAVTLQCAGQLQLPAWRVAKVPLCAF